MSSSNLESNKATSERVVIVHTPNSEKYHKMKLVDGEERPMCNQRSNIHGQDTKYRVWDREKAEVWYSPCMYPACYGHHAKASVSRKDPI
jgi:hypothetical protein